MAPEWQDAAVSGISTTIIADTDGPTYVTEISFQTSTATYAISCYKRGLWKCPRVALSDKVKVLPDGGDLRVRDANGKEMKRRLISAAPITQ